MKKIMFNDKYGLTKAVLDCRKTLTRRVVKLSLHKKMDNDLIEVFPTKVFLEDSKWKFIYDDYVFLLPKESYPRFKVGEVVSVAQSYRDCGGVNEDGMPIWEIISQKVGGINAGWNNKMFVRADLMPHQIRITDVRVEQLQEISDEDCLKEGLEWDGIASQYYVGFQKENGRKTFLGKTAHEAFAHLINKVSRKDVWSENPYVFVYDFELVK